MSLKSILADIGEKIDPSIKKERLGYEKKSAATDRAIARLVNRRKMKNKNKKGSKYIIPPAGASDGTNWGEPGGIATSTATTTDKKK